MPKNKNAMTRYQILNELLSNRYHNYSIGDLTDEMNRRLDEMDIMDGICAGMGGNSSRKMSDLSHQEEALMSYLNTPLHIPFDAAFVLSAV